MHVPQVHAFNVLRFVFADKELTTETVGFAAKGLTAAIKGFSSPHWEVRFVSVDFRDFFAEVIVTHACASLSRAVCASATARARLVLDVLRNVQAGARASRAGTRARNRARRVRGAIRTFSNVLFFFSPPRDRFEASRTDRRLTKKNTPRLLPFAARSDRRCATARRWRTPLCSRRLWGT